MPGSPLDPRAEGTNDLIRQGATLVGEVDHVLAVLAPLVSGETPVARDQPDLEDRPIFWDEIDLDGIAVPVPAPSLDVQDLPEPEDPRARLIGALSPAPIGTDALARETGLAVRSVRTILLELELDGRIERHGSGTVSLIR